MKRVVWNELNEIIIIICRLTINCCAEVNEIIIIIRRLAINCYGGGHAWILYMLQFKCYYNMKTSNEMKLDRNQIISKRNNNKK